MTSPFALTGKAALIIGPATALTRALAVGLAEAGAEVAVASLHREEAFSLNSIANEVWAIRGRSLALPIEATIEEQVGEAVRRTLSELGRLDILVNAQDLVLHKPLLETSLAEWRRVFDANVTAAFLAARYGGPPMIEQGKGRVINISSILGERGVANSAAYGAAKAAVINFTRALAIEWARTGVTVNAIGLGWLADVPGAGQDLEARGALERYLPQRRLTVPHDAVGALVYLASDAAAFVTGEILFVEGAALAHA